MLKGPLYFGLGGIRAVCTAFISKGDGTAVSEAAHFGIKLVGVVMGVPWMDAGSEGDVFGAVI